MSLEYHPLKSQSAPDVRPGPVSLAEGSPDLADVRKCLETLNAFTRDRSLLTHFDQETRKQLMMAAGQLSRPNRYEHKQLVKAFRKKEKREIDRISRQSRSTTGIRRAREASVFTAPALEADGGTATVRALGKEQSCYVCKADFRELHFFYDSMCPACAKLNYEKRFQSAPLDGRVALVTGGRVKIGYHTALKMLRSGATVVVTTRFPHDSAQRYAVEPDFSVWQHRLRIFGLDLRHSPSVEILASYLKTSLSQLDILINNAAQTVRRPAEYYGHLIAYEELDFSELPEANRGLLADFYALKCLLTKGPTDSGKILEPLGETLMSVKSAAASRYEGNTGVGITGSAALSQIRVNYDEDDRRAAEIFPAGRLDADLQQVDLRDVNSWRLRLADVATAEMLEVHLVNAVAPFVLCAKLKPLMLKAPGAKFIVNASAMEGKFTRYVKTDKHPHTNMAKAALNMMTLTSAPDYARDQIYMNAVDTGWVTDEDPAVFAERKTQTTDFQPPLDIVDGAARLLDPVYAGLNSGDPIWGKFLKDYAPTSW